MEQLTTKIEGFSGPQVCTLVGITYRQLDYWARTG
ncbi:MAG: MerR family transcriptional regulator, partial [Actinobacteria bacterium]|nr:MerR family transcriptional regulator [Actinomycetota bacterium]